MQIYRFNRASNLKSTLVKSVLVAMGVISTALLSGCAGVNGSFACDKTAGDSCESMSMVNQQTDAGAFAQGDGGTAQNSTVESAAPVNPSGFDVATPQAGAPIRYGESVARIWIAPFEDKEGNYHEPSYVYTVIQSSHWIGAPAKSIQAIGDDGEDS